MNKLLTFKEVHADLEREGALLLKEHNVVDFSEKAAFLESIGFKNSKATRMYKAIAESKEYVNDFNTRYGGSYKFILKEQLERVCERYNLFVRPLKFFAADIPEKNIKDMRDFRVHLDDVLGKIDKNHLSIFRHSVTSLNDLVMRYMQFNVSDTIVSSIEAEARACISRYMMVNYFTNTQGKFTLSTLEAMKSTVLNALPSNASIGNLLGSLKIAAVEDMFLPSAFKEEKNRIPKEGVINLPELKPTGRVDLDPIVMLETTRGYIIITAWGDEANDELIVNHNMN